MQFQSKARAKGQRARIAQSLLSMALLHYAVSAYADFVVDTKYNGLSKNITQMSWDEQQQLRLFDEKWGRNILKGIAGDNDGISLTRIPSGNGKGHVLWNGNHYYAWVVHYYSAEQDREYDSAIAKKRKSVALPGGGVCALYVFDQDLNKLTSLKIDLPENNHGTWCNGIYGLGGAGKAMDGVLVAISYYLTGEKPAQRAQDIGNGWRYMTVLIRFEDQEGRLALKQDDSCLDNPNDFNAIAAARKALTVCSNAR